MRGVAGSGASVGSVQTIVCSRDGRELWRRDVWVPRKQCAAFYGRYLAVAAGVFFYDVSGRVERRSRRPSGIPLWSD